jgi:cell division septation protein DedD
MASGGKRGAGDRVLESKHVIGLFLLMLLFSGVFFTLGYVMGRNQYDGQVRAANTTAGRTEPLYMPKADAAPKKDPDSRTVDDSASSDSDPSTESSSPAWNFPASSSSAKVDPHLEPPPASRNPEPSAKPAVAKSKPQPQPVATHAPSKPAKSITNAPLIPGGAYVIQVAALLKQDDALGIANSLQKKHYSAFVQTPQKDKYYRVQVGPFKDQKSADAAKKGLEGEGFKAFYVKH